MNEVASSVGHEAKKSFTALKLAVLDAAACDQRLTHLDFRLLYYLASASDRQTGIARRKQKVIAAALGVTPRAVQLCTEHLVTAGYVTVILKEGGTYTHGYEIMVGKANTGTSNGEAEANPASPPSGKRRTERMEKANDGANKGEPPFAPTLPLNSLDIPSLAQPLPELVSLCLRERLGNDVCRSWFSNVTVANVAGGVVTLKASEPFYANWIIDKFEPALLDAWRALDPSIERVAVISAPAVAHPCPPGGGGRKSLGLSRGRTG